MTEPSAWVRMTQEDPEHSAAYIQRFRNLAGAGHGPGGRGAAGRRDAAAAGRGCSTPAAVRAGSAGTSLGVGHDVVGVDVDPVLIAAAEEDHPGPRWLVGDLAELDLPAPGIAEPFDAIVCAGNVMAFLAPSTRGAPCCAGCGRTCADDGRAAIGFGAGRGYDFDDFLADAARRRLGARTCCCPRGTCGRSTPRRSSWSRSCGRPEPAGAHGVSPSERPPSASRPPARGTPPAARPRRARRSRPTPAPARARRTRPPPRHRPSRRGTGSGSRSRG